MMLNCTETVVGRTETETGKNLQIYRPRPGQDVQSPLTLPMMCSMAKLSQPSKVILPVEVVSIWEKRVIRLIRRSCCDLNISEVGGARPNLLGAAAAHSIISSNSAGSTSPYPFLSPAWNVLSKK